MVARIVLSILLLFTTLPLTGAISVSLHCNTRQVGVNEPFIVQVRVEGLDSIGGEFQLSHPAVFQSSKAGFSQNVHMTQYNNKMERRYVFGQRFRLLPKRIGVYRVGPGIFQYQGKRYSTDTLRITVRRHSISGGLQRRDPFARMRRFFEFQDPFQESEQEKLRCFAALAISPETPFEQQEVLLFLDIYMNRRSLRGVRSISRPELQGFWREETSRPGEHDRRVKWRSVKQVRYQGEDWYRYRVLLAYLYPTSPGTRTVPKVQSVVYCEDFLDRLRSLQADPLTFRVRPLPKAGQPPDFSGLVGRFSLALQGTNQSLRQNSPFELEVVVEGRGNIQSLSELPARYAAGKWRLLTPTLRTRLDRSLDGIQGERVFTYTVYPLATGELALPSFSLVYFDPGQERYHRVKSGGRQVSVAAGRAGGPTAAHKEQQGLAAGRLHLYVSQREGHYSLLPLPPAFLAWILGGLALGTVFSFWRYRQREFFAGNPAAGRRAAALHEARSCLRRGDALLQEGQIAAGLGEAERALKRFVLRKLGRAGENVMVRDLTHALAAVGIPHSLIEEFADIVQQCAAARYGVAPDDSSASRLFDRSRQLLSRLQAAWKDAAAGGAP